MWDNPAPIPTELPYNDNAVILLYLSNDLVLHSSPPAPPRPRNIRNNRHICHMQAEQSFCNQFCRSLNKTEIIKSALYYGKTILKTFCEKTHFENIL